MGFKKALGILNKAKQGGLFAPKYNPNALGHTRSGKPVIRMPHTAESFHTHHKDWTSADHRDARVLHEEHGQTAFDNLESSLGREVHDYDTVDSNHPHMRSVNYHSAMEDIHDNMVALKSGRHARLSPSSARIRDFGYTHADLNWDLARSGSAAANRIVRGET